MQGQPEKIVAVHEGIELKGKGKVKLTITDSRLIVEKKAFIFLQKLSTIIVVAFPKIVNVSHEAEVSVKVSYVADSEHSTAIFVAKSKSQALGILNQISDTLLEIMKKQEEASKRKKEEEVTDVLFTSYILESMLNIWAIVSPLHKLLKAMQQEEWGKAEAEARIIVAAANELTKDSETSLTSIVRDFSNAVQSRAPEAVNSKVSELLSSLGSMTGSSSTISKRWSQYSRGSNPNWSSVAYFLLFALAVNELLISSDLGRIKEAEESLLRIRKLLPVMEAKVGKYLVDGVNESIVNKEIFEIPQKVSNLLSNELQRYLSRAAS